jgi:hypothetical protein
MGSIFRGSDVVSYTVYPDTVSFNMLLAGYLATKSVVAAESVVRFMWAKRVPCDAATYKSMILMNLSPACMDDALKWKDLMYDDAIVPDPKTLETLAGAMMKHSLWDLLFRLLNDTVKRGELLLPTIGSLVAKVTGLDASKILNCALQLCFAVGLAGRVKRFGASEFECLVGHLITVAQECRAVASEVERSGLHTLASRLSVLADIVVEAGCASFGRQLSDESRLMFAHVGGTEDDSTEVSRFPMEIDTEVKGYQTPIERPLVPRWSAACNAVFESASHCYWLVHASKSGNAALITSLLHQPAASVAALRPAAWSAFVIALKSGREAVVVKLLQTWPTLLEQSDPETDQTPLHLACEQGAFGAVCILVLSSLLTLSSFASDACAAPR